MAHAWVCRTCAVQHGPSDQPPASCVICSDERQYVDWDEQQWATLTQLGAEGYRCDIRSEEPGLVGVGVQPPLGIGQRALLVATPHGNVLWDCVGYIDDLAVEQIRDLGGVSAISVSHPHFYGALIDYSHAFGARVLLPAADRQWVRRPDPVVEFYSGATELLPGVTLVPCGGHFPGSAVLHWAGGAEGRGVLLTGDTITVVRDRRYVSFMYSYPNLIPLPAAAVRRVVEAVSSYPFDRLYGGWWGHVVARDAQAAIARSAERYVQATS